MKKEIEVKFDDLEWLYSQNWEYFDYGTSRNCIMIFRNWRSWRNRELLLCQLRFVSLILQFFRRR